MWISNFLKYSLHAMFGSRLLIFGKCYRKQCIWMCLSLWHVYTHLVNSRMKKHASNIVGSHLKTKSYPTPYLTLTNEWTCTFIQIFILLNKCFTDDWIYASYDCRTCAIKQNVSHNNLETIFFLTLYFFLLTSSYPLLPPHFWQFFFPGRNAFNDDH